MLNIDGYSKGSLELVNSMLYAEGQPNPLEGECGQKQKREQAKQARTPAQAEADRTRAQANRGRDNVPSATRSEAARKAAETRKRCKGGASTPPQPG
jgi:hypothetical protein